MRLTMLAALISAAFLGAGLVLAKPVQIAELEVEIAGLRSDSGVIMLGLYDNPEAFEKALDFYEKPDGFVRDRGRLLGAAIRLDTGIRKTVLGGLEPGRYAVILFHDENQDGKLDKNVIGVPTEGFGFSNNASGLLSAPDFADALVTLGADRTRIQIDLRY